ncbi:hypothetical protein Tco_0331432, partial [Tanacetum coccineum]
EIPDTTTTAAMTQKEDDLTVDDLKQYEVEIKAMNLILISIPNDIYNFVDGCKNAKEMWDRVKRLMHDSYDTLFDHLQQYEGIVNASRAKRVAKTHDPLALVANTYARELICDDQEYSLTTAMMSLARAITQRYTTPTNNRLRTSSNTMNQAVVQADRVDIQSRNVGNAGHYARDCPKPRVRDSRYSLEQLLIAKKDEAGIMLNAEHNDFLLVDAPEIEEVEDLSATKFPKDVQVMMDVFELMESELDETLKQNELLNDLILKATLTHDVEKCVLMHFELKNDNLSIEIEKVKSESKDVQENLLKRIKIIENNFQRCQAQSIDFELQLQHKKNGL